MTERRAPRIGSSTATELGPIPQEELARDTRCPPCRKKRKPSEPRTVCYRGTYVERSRGLSKYRKEEVPCESVGKSARASVASLFDGGAPQRASDLLRKAVQSQLGQRAIAEGIRSGTDWLTVKARDVLGEEWVPLTPEEKRQRKRAKRKRS